MTACKVRCLACSPQAVKSSQWIYDSRQDCAHKAVPLQVSRYATPLAEAQDLAWGLCSSARSERYGEFMLPSHSTQKVFN